MTGHKHQHTIPRCYLAAWTEPYTPVGQKSAIWRISKDRSQVRRKSPEKSFTETDRYTVLLENGTRNLAVENTLASIENDYTDVLRSIRRNGTLTSLQRARLCTFTAAMLGRSKKQGDHFKRQLIAHKEKISQMEDRFHANKSLSAELEAVIKTSHADSVLAIIEAATPILFGMKLTILTTEDSIGFITSDAPAVMYNPKAYTTPPFYRSPGLLQNGIEVTLPLSPQHIALFAHKSVLGPYFPIEAKAVGEINRTTYFHCQDEFVSWKGEMKSEWFEERDVPADVWERHNEISKL